MEIVERLEAHEVKQGVQVTITPDAHYFYFRRGAHVLCVRVPNEERNATGREIEFGDKIIETDFLE